MDWIVTVLALRCDVSLHFVGQDGTIQAGILQTDDRFENCFKMLKLLEGFASAL